MSEYYFRVILGNRYKVLVGRDKDRTGIVVHATVDPRDENILYVVIRTDDGDEFMVKKDWLAVA